MCLFMHMSNDVGNNRALTWRGDHSAGACTKGLSVGSYVLARLMLAQLRVHAGMSMRTAGKAALWCSMALIVPTALALPCGSLVFWLSSSCLMIGWVRVQVLRLPLAFTALQGHDS